MSLTPKHDWQKSSRKVNLKKFNSGSVSTLLHTGTLRKWQELIISTFGLKKPKPRRHRNSTSGSTEGRLGGAQEGTASSN